MHTVTLDELLVLTSVSPNFLKHNYVHAKIGGDEYHTRIIGVGTESCSCAYINTFYVEKGSTCYKYHDAEKFRDIVVEEIHKD